MTDLDKQARNLIRAAMLQRHLSGAELSRMIGRDRTLVCHMLRDGREMRLSTVQRFCDAMDCDVFLTVKMRE